jgi:hypothetical protein
LETSNYRFSDKLLHHLALGIPAISKLSFDIDQFSSDNKHDNYQIEKPVFISGLARAGTTILMRTLFDTGQFRSLTYRDMPFVLMPNTWQKLSKLFQTQQAAKERSHGDGIMIDFDSPEAFEEIFWQTFFKDEYIFADCIKPHHVDQEGIEKFRLYIQYILSSARQQNKRTRYLSKNNNNILRLNSIRAAFPQALIITPFRDPVQHSISLLKQHLNLSDQRKNDKFSADYMRYLGHYEFGVHHKPFRFKTKSNADSSINYAQDDINYWLTIWKNSHTYLLENATKETVFLYFEDLCEQPYEVLSKVFEFDDLTWNKEEVEAIFHQPTINTISGVDTELQNQAQIIYEKLRKKF